MPGAVVVLVVEADGVDEVPVGADVVDVDVVCGQASKIDVKVSKIHSRTNTNRCFTIGPPFFQIDLV